MEFVLGGDTVIDVSQTTMPDKQMKKPNYKVASFANISLDNNLSLGYNVWYTTASLDAKTINDYQILAGITVITTICYGIWPRRWFFL